eukprot:CAMPEP_0177770338 /NCGR_PEP_ID=MMETSP0491_2-20121128/10865_1 /TAXON_ID=63592 /ORGANISM="Tetraselmis chuii, Strain PLY429" /LENGTH=90 /DNA_ID=CAMNT_0019287533 /DNA_START=243 /DNA_END=515 /DNA_ORIENTATION=-
MRPEAISAAARDAQNNRSESQMQNGRITSRRSSLEELAVARQRNLDELQTMDPSGNLRHVTDDLLSPGLLMENGSAKHFQTYDEIPLDGL